MPEAQWGVKPLVEVAGRPLPPDVALLLEDVAVDDSLHLPDMVELRLRDDRKDVLSRAGIRLGVEVRVSARATGRQPAELLLTAEVAAIEADHGPRGTHFLVRGYDLSWRLSQERRTVAHMDMTDSDAAQRIAKEAGVPVGTVDATSVVHPHLAQVDLTDWEFLQLRARASGRECVMVKGEMHFRVPRPASEAPAPATPTSQMRRHELAVGSNLLVFKPRISAHGQVKDVEVRGWDPTTKRAVVARAGASSAGVLALERPTQVAEVTGGRVHVAVDRGVSTQAEAMASATALAEVLGSTHVEARGTALGDPSLNAGTAVSISGSGRLFDGQYVLTSTRHVYDALGYRTLFEISGRSERSLLGLLSGGSGAGGSGASPGGRTVPGVAIGEVTDARDPESNGRLRVRLPWLSDAYETHWARVVQLGAGNGRGSAWLPEVGDEVLVAFEQGDVRRPVIVGGLHNGKDALPLRDGLVDGTDGAVQKRGFVSRAGHQLVLDDSRDAPGVLLASGDGNLTVQLAQSDAVITVSSSGDVEISGGGNVTVTGTAGVKVSSDAGIEIHATARLSLKGDAGVEISGGPEVSVSAASVRLG